MDGYKLVPYRDRFLDEMRGTGALPDVPLIVLTAMDIDEFKKAVFIGESESLLRHGHRRQAPIHDALAASVPRGENRLIDSAGHASLHWPRPEAVLQAIQELLGRRYPGVIATLDAVTTWMSSDRFGHGQGALGRRSGSLGARCGTSWCVASSGVWTL